MLEHLPKVIRSFIYIFLLIFSILLLSCHEFIVYSCEIVQGVKKHSSAISKDRMEEASHPETPENRSNREVTKITKDLVARCVPPRLDASLRNIDESGCRQREIYGDNGTFFRKLSATPIRPTGTFPAYLAHLQGNVTVFNVPRGNNASNLSNNLFRGRNHSLSQIRAV